MKKSVTAALPYANGALHMGHLAGEYIPADIYVRFQRLLGRKATFICDSDGLVDNVGKYKYLHHQLRLKHRC